MCQMNGTEPCSGREDFIPDASMLGIAAQYSAAAAKGKCSGAPGKVFRELLTSIEGRATISPGIRLSQMINS